MATTQPRWTSEEDRELIRMFEEGSDSIRMRKVLVNRTKNAIMGRIRRLNLHETHERPEPIAKKPAAPVRLRRRTASKLTIRRILNGTDAPRGYTISKWNPKTCQWPSGSVVDGDLEYCGEQVALERPYCPKHCSMAYVNADTRQPMPQSAFRTAESN